MAYKKAFKHNKKKNKNKRRLRPSFMISLSMALVSLAWVIGGFAYYEVQQYEKGILSVCADQQDAYVQLILDQINLKANREDEEIITDILGSLDASAKAYWVFSKNQSLVYVKNVLETNKYKGFSTGTFYDSASGRLFLEQIKLNTVSHSEIEVEGKRFIASGTAFEYGGNNYKLCLLTERQLFFENNTFMEAKIEIYSIFLVVLLLLILIPLYLAEKLAKASAVKEEQQETITALHHKIMKLNEQLQVKLAYDEHLYLWTEKEIPVFLRKIEERGMGPIAVAHISCVSEEAKIRFLQKARVLLNKKVLRFSYDEKDLVLMGVHMTKNMLMINTMGLIDDETVLKKNYELPYVSPSGITVILKMLGLNEEEEDAQQTIS